MHSEQHYILHLETATKSCSVSLSCNGVHLATTEEHSSAYTHAETLTLYIEETLKKSSVNLKQLSAISVSAGPGSYTGLRIGVSTAKGLCYALNIPLIAVDTLTSLSALVKEKSNSVLAAIDARRMEIYSLFVNSNGGKIKNVSADIVNSESYTEFEPFTVIGDANEKLETLWRDRNGVNFLSLLPSAAGQVKISWEKFKSKKFEDLAYFEPFYLKDFKK